VQPGSSDTVLVQRCPVNFMLASANKGFEGAHVFKGKDGSRYLIGLCEGEPWHWRFRVYLRTCASSNTWTSAYVPETFILVSGCSCS
jgi:hypothetical protein